MPMSVVELGMGVESAVKVVEIYTLDNKGVLLDTVAVDNAKEADVVELDIRPQVTGPALP